MDKPEEERRQKQERQLREGETDGREEPRGSRNSRRRRRRPAGQNAPDKENVPESEKMRGSDETQSSQGENSERAEKTEKRENAQYSAAISEEKPAGAQPSNAQSSPAKPAENELPVFETHPSMVGVEQRNELTEKWIADRAARRAGGPRL